jgi:DNA-binding MarR family transcriptional regulator
MEQREELLEDFVREVRQFNGLGASFFRAAAARIRMNVTDLQVTDILDMTGPTTAGQLAELMGLTTGAITGMIDRLEKANLVTRERDPNDGRRVIVRLASGGDALQETGLIFESMEQGWDEIASRYDDAQLALLVDFLKQSNAVSRQEISRLRDAPGVAEGAFSSPLEGVESGKLVVFSAMSQLDLRAGSGMTDLYQAMFEGTTPKVKAEGGTVSIRYPERLWLAGSNKRSAIVTLNNAIPWRIAVRGGASGLNAELGGLDLIDLEVKGGASSLNLNLPVPSRVVPIRISGSASEIVVRRPVGVAARAHMKGWVTEFAFDDQAFSGMGSDSRVQSRDFQASEPHYDIEVESSASTVVITSGE